MFWGLIMEPNKRYTQVVEKPFHISQAAMDISTGDSEACQVMVVVDGKNFLVCTLQKKHTIQVPLDLYFKAGDSVSFLTNGKCNVHLTGYLDPEYEDDLSDEEAEEEEEDEAPELVGKKNKRKLENNTDGSASKKAKPDKKAAKKPAAEDSDDSDEDEDQLQKFLDGEEIDTDENDDSFKANTSAEGDDSDEEDSDDDDEEAEDEAEENEESSEEGGDTSMDTSKDSKPDLSTLSKNARKRLQKKLKKQGEQPQVNGVDKAKKEKPAEQKKDQKKKEVKTEEAATGDKKEKKSLSGGVFIEDLKVGSGAPAKPGKVVQVYYEGRLKSNNKKFDDCVKGPGFKFRLGSKEVISGWDVGVAGMKVGGKRRIVCPPAMAYGAKGSPPVIPPNSTLVFEVELKNVK